MRLKKTQLSAQDVQDINFDTAPYFKKLATLHKGNVYIAASEEVILTRHVTSDGVFTETNTIAKEGDYVVRRNAYDAYVIKSDKFPQLYEIDSNNPNVYTSKGTGRAVLVEDDTTLTPPWGGEQNIRAGGVIFDNGSERYGNQKESFEEDFGRLAQDGSLMPLSKPLEEQKRWAEEKGEALHLNDIEERIKFEERSNSASNMLDVDVEVAASQDMKK